MLIETAKYLAVGGVDALVCHGSSPKIDSEGNVHTSSTKFEISRISKFSGRGEQTLSELPEALRSLSAELPALSFAKGGD